MIDGVLATVPVETHLEMLDHQVAQQMEASVDLQVVQTLMPLLQIIGPVTVKIGVKAAHSQMSLVTLQSE